MERQVGSIPRDHLARYEFAAKYVYGPTLDAACGSGYGTDILRKATGRATGVDIHAPTIEYAKEHFPDCEFICGDLLTAPWVKGYMSVVSFETLEHIHAPQAVLRYFRKSCADVLICSVPNENLYPFDPKVFENDEFPHLRHYTPEAFTGLLEGAGWEVARMYCQVSKNAPEVVEGVSGRYLIAVCQ